MSVYTSADKALDDLKNNVNLSIGNTNTFLNTETWGNDEYNKEFKKKIFNIQQKLQDIQFELQNP